MTILIVELADAECQGLVRTCTQAQCPAVAVWDGGAAVDYLQMTAVPVWIILLDLEIALADAALCTALRYGHVGGVPIVIMSALQDTATVAARLGIGAYLTRPFAPDTIDALVRCYAPLANAVG